MTAGWGAAAIAAVERVFPDASSFVLGMLETSVLLSQSLQSIQNDRLIDETEKRRQAEAAFKKELERGIGRHNRIAFGLAQRNFDFLTSSVAAEELHEAYLRVCQRQRSKVQENGCLLAVYQPRGMGKSCAAFSLLTMRHSRSPRRAIYFGGTATSYASGDAYFDALLDHKIASGWSNLSRFSDHGIFSPVGLAQLLLTLMKGNEAYLTDRKPVGSYNVPGLRAFLDARGDLHGGTPVTIFDDVNIKLTAPEPTKIREEEVQEQVCKWTGELGKAGAFFEYLITNGHQVGAIIILTTKLLHVAKYFQHYNGGQKAMLFKQYNGKGPWDNLDCQGFQWTLPRRRDLLTLQNGLKDESVRLSDAEIANIATDSLTIADDPSIREMMSVFDEAIGANMPRQALSAATIEDPSAMEIFFDYIGNFCK